MDVRTLTRCDFSHLDRVLLWPFNRYVWLVTQLRYAEFVNSKEVYISTTNLAARVYVCVQNLTNLCPYALISTPNVP